MDIQLQLSEPGWQDLASSIVEASNLIELFTGILLYTMVHKNVAAFF